MSNKKIKTLRSNGKYLASIFGEKCGYIETEGFSSKKERQSWIKSELKNIRRNEEDGEENFFAIIYDYTGFVL